MATDDIDLESRGLESDVANELYLAVANMRANSGRMRALAENARSESDAAMTDYSERSRAPEYSPRSPDEFAFDPRAHLDAAAEHFERGRLPDLNALAEMMLKMRGAQRAYELNMQMLDATHEVMARTVDLLRR